MTEAEEAAVVSQQAGVGVQVDVGPVGHVGTEALQTEEEREFVAHEVRRAGGPGLGVGPVERDDAGAVGEVRTSGRGGAVVEAVAPVEVVGLPGGDAVHEDERRHGRVVSDGERDELLLPTVADQFQQVTPGQPLLGDADGHGGRPGAGHRAGPRGNDRRRLAARRHHVALPDQAAAEPLVVTHAIRLHLDGLGRRVDEQGYVVADHRAHLAGVALEGVVRLDEIAYPVERARPGVLGDQPGRGRDDHAARQLRVDHRRHTLLFRPAGPACTRWGGFLDVLLSTPAPRATPVAPNAESWRNCRRSSGRRSEGSGDAAAWEPPSGGRRRTRRVYPDTPVQTQRPFGSWPEPGTPYHSGVTWARSIPGPLRRALARLVHAGWEAAVDLGAIGPDDARGRRFGRLGRGACLIFPQGAIYNEHLIQIGEETIIGPGRASRPGWRPARSCRPTPWCRSGVAA